MLKTTRKLTLTVIFSIVLATVAVFASLFPDAKFVFSGMTMQNGANGKVQGFVDLTLKNIDATGVSFTIRYDKNYLIPSDHTTNEGTDDFEKFFLQNTDNFPKTGSDNSLSLISAMDSDSGDTGTFSLLTIPNIDYPMEDSGSYIGFSPDYENTDDRYRYIAADGEPNGVHIGTLSFQIVDPAGISRLSEAELNDIFYIDEDAGISVMYYDEENKEVTEPAEFDWNIEMTLIEVLPVSKEIRVLAPDIYNLGTEQDLIDYLNFNHPHVQLRWSNEDITLDSISWDGCTISGDPYDPRGGTYKVTLPYNEKFSISVTVNVLPVTLTGFSVNNFVIVFGSGVTPKTWEELEIPTVAEPILDRVVTRFDLPDIALERENWTPNDIPEDLANGVSGTYTFTTTIDYASQYNAPWLTIGEFDTDVLVERIKDPNLYSPPLETEIVASVAKYTGILTIDVFASIGQIEEGTTFRVKFPSGLILDTSNPAMTVTIADGNAQIIIDTSLDTTGIGDTLQADINLGREGFQLAMKEPHKPAENKFVDFLVPQRENHFTQNEAIDYSGSKKSFFTAIAGTSLDDLTKHVVLMDDSVIHIAYDGMTGTEPGEMKEVYVESWSINENPSATHLPANADETITLVGVMKEDHYTNHGDITNTDEYVLELTVTTVTLNTLPTNMQIEITTNETEVYKQIVDELHPFYFDTKQVGYTEAQIQTFTVHLLSPSSISSMEVEIDNTDFILVSQPDPFLSGAGAKTQFRIGTKAGLAAGNYTAQVRVKSNDGSFDDKVFYIHFTVTDEPVFKVTVTVNDPALGDARVVGSAYYTAGSSVDLVATAATGCEFKEWQSADVSSIHGSTIYPNETFTMPEYDVTINAVFEETVEGKLRLSDLRVKNPDNSDNLLRDSANSVISFSPDVDEYYVTVPYATDRSKIWLKQRYPEIDGTVITPVITKDDGTGIPVTLDGADDYYKTSLFDLAEGENIYKITQSYDGTERTYTVTITRKSEPGVTLPLGNSPYGLIEADGSINQTAAKAYFDANWCYDVAGNLVPDGVTYTSAQKYYPDAWTDKNPDKDPTALFVYSGDAFVDPGFKDLKDSDGQPVDAASVRRTIKAMQLDNPAGTDAAAKLTSVSEITDTMYGGESCIIETAKNYNLRPDVYSIVYSFTDADGEENTFSRPLVILSNKGDSDVDGDTDTDDYNNIYNRMGNGISAGIINQPDSWCAVYSYRILDVNSDRNVNSIDANNIRSNGGITQFYEKLPDSPTT